MELGNRGVFTEVTFVPLEHTRTLSGWHPTYTLLHHCLIAQSKHFKSSQDLCHPVTKSQVGLSSCNAIYVFLILQAMLVKDLEGRHCLDKALIETRTSWHVGTYCLICIRYWCIVPQVKTIICISCKCSRQIRCIKYIRGIWLLKTAWEI